MKVKTKVDVQSVVRQELFAIAKERGITVNPHWNTKHLAQVVTKEVVSRHTTKSQRAWASRRQLFGDSGLRNVKGERRWERTRKEVRA